MQHMLEHAREAVELLAGRTRQDLDQDRLLSLALTRLLEIVGEAAGRVSPEARARVPEVPWSEIVSLRNRLIHGYDVVDHDILWNIVHDDLPSLSAQLETHLQG
jgi:uncharacterized protein with HEPN domain